MAETAEGRNDDGEKKDAGRRSAATFMVILRSGVGSGAMERMNESNGNRRRLERIESLYTFL